MALEDWAGKSRGATWTCSEGSTGAASIGNADVAGDVCSTWPSLVEYIALGLDCEEGRGGIINRSEP